MNATDYITLVGLVGSIALALGALVYKYAIAVTTLNERLVQVEHALQDLRRDIAGVRDLPLLEHRITQIERELKRIRSMLDIKAMRRKSVTEPPESD